MHKFPLSLALLSSVSMWAVAMPAHAAPEELESLYTQRDIMKACSQYPGTARQGCLDAGQARLDRLHAQSQLQPQRQARPQREVSAGQECVPGERSVACAQQRNQTAAQPGTAPMPREDLIARLSQLLQKKAGGLCDRNGYQECMAALRAFESQAFGKCDAYKFGSSGGMFVQKLQDYLWANDKAAITRIENEIKERLQGLQELQKYGDCTAGQLDTMKDLGFTAFEQASQIRKAELQEQQRAAQAKQACAKSPAYLKYTHARDILEMRQVIALGKQAIEDEKRSAKISGVIDQRFLHTMGRDIDTVQTQLERVQAEYKALGGKESELQTLARNKPCDD